MDGKINSSRENPMLGRKEVAADVSFDKSTPNRKEIKELLCAKLGANPDSVVINGITSKFGQKVVTVTMHVYQTKEAALAMEPRHILARDGMAERKAKKAKKKAAPPAQKK